MFRTEVTSLWIVNSAMNASGFNAISKLFSECIVTKQCVKCATRRYSSFSVGDKAALSKTFTKDDVETFAKISMDNNPLHTDPDFAKTTIFGKCIVHGVLQLTSLFITSRHFYSLKNHRNFVSTQLMWFNINITEFFFSFCICVQ